MNQTNEPVAWMWNDEPDNNVVFSGRNTPYPSDATPLYIANNNYQLVAQAYFSDDGGCEQIDWLGTINPVVDEEFTPLYACLNSPNTITITTPEYAKLKEDSERYRYMRNESSVMLWDAQKWATSHRLDVLVDQAIKESK